VAFLIIVWQFGCVHPADAQQGLTTAADVVFYGDNTEFRNPFREGETLFGATARIEARIEMSDAVTLLAGVFGNQRFGSDEGFDLVRPVLALLVKGGRSEFLFGTLSAPRVGVPAGPDRAGPHGLLPPIQRETLAFERPYEAGLQWVYSAPRLRHDAWLNWQRLNTPQHRERLDAGIRGEWRIAGPFSIPLQTHIVHEGGQLFAVGPVRDSFALASGIAITCMPGAGGGKPSPGGNPAGSAPLAVMFEVLGLWSRYTPDREARNPTRQGGAFLGRASVEGRGWRGHLIAFRGDDFIKDEGDPNYMSIRRDGSRYRGVRDYAEAGIARTFDVARGASIETSLRLHRVERHYEYSYRVLGIVKARARIK
jgi:hypothetical protein